MKTLVLGFDGASPKLVDKWIMNLPAFKAFKEHGIFGQTIPPTPAQTPVAWTTFMTGKNPGNHGIFSFAVRESGTYERKINRPEMIDSKTLWRILSDEGRRVGVVNVPMSDSEKVNGFIIPGFLSRSEGIPYPNHIRDKIRLKFNVDKITGDLETETLNNAERDPDIFFERVNEITDEMTEISLYLLQEEKWDFFIVVYMGLDRIQHFFWKNIDSAHSKYHENIYSKLARHLYVKTDRIIGSFLNSIDEDTMVIVVSDHGFCPIHREVLVNNYLEEHGFLKTENGKIDLEKSKAVSYGYGDIWLNVKRREPKGIIKSSKEYEATREEIIVELKDILIDGEKPIKDVKKREELYWGKHQNKASDLTIIFNVGWQASRNPEITSRNRQKRYVNENPRWSGGHDGTHDPNDVPGILAILGPEIQSGKRITTHLWDIAPTILQLMDIPIPNDLDGRPVRIT